jgi:tetratricopeptide (TPR) repeat protein
VLGARESDPAHLIEAVTVYREALKERTREKVPLAWATTQNNLGNALQALGELESDPARFTGAVTAYREALKELTRERVPLDWANTQNNLGNALRSLGLMESDLERLQEAATAYHAALLEYRVAKAQARAEGVKSNLQRVQGEISQRKQATAKSARSRSS